MKNSDNEILTEYEEILTQKLGPDIASNVIKAILDLPNTRMVQVYYHLRLITADPDDDKFVDCAFKTNARFIVTEDHHYDVLRKVKYPVVNVIDIDSFLIIYKSYTAIIDFFPKIPCIFHFLCIFAPPSWEKSAGQRKRILRFVPRR